MASVSQNPDTQINLPQTSSHILILISNSQSQSPRKPNHAPPVIQHAESLHDHRRGCPSHHERRRSCLWEQVRAEKTPALLSLSQHCNVPLLTSIHRSSCAGSSLTPSLSDCEKALANINTGSTYTDQAQFSVGTCYMIYATNGAGPQSLSGQGILDTAQSILDDCTGYKGSFGTNNCESCHVTVNYRS